MSRRRSPSRFSLGLKYAFFVIPCLRVRVYVYALENYAEKGCRSPVRLFARAQGRSSRFDRSGRPGGLRRGYTLSSFGDGK